MHKFFRRLAAAALATALLTGAALYALQRAIPDVFYVEPGERLSIASMPWLSADSRSSAGQLAVSAPGGNAGGGQTLKLFGLFPIKTVQTVSEDRREVTVCGTPFGIKMFSNGALVVAFSDLYTEQGSENPAKEAGLRLGDLIVSASGHTVRNNEELSAAITGANGGEMEVVYLRDGVRRTCKLTPVRDQDGSYKAGVWVRDSSAGIGTLTFADTQHGTFAGLGHAISDTDTGTSISLLSGEIVPVNITGCAAGAAGAPGELRGDFSGTDVLGTVLANDATGVYGKLSSTVAGNICPVANSQEIQPGAAQILATVEGSTPQLYDVRIEYVNLNASDPNRNMQIRVTDPDLLAKTGGIVQGMSGSPILQNGMLVGAVTHVLINDPTRGYGIFARTMLEGADRAAGGETG
ncbi:SpoIVB peptidase [uncultured Gemmiger sp.]|uniref:SpoIVB peptidase n=1 Tax=uncultured Gemmiger sp. TaxID=1623490 RepID=UPI0025CC9B2C|nr:SpoIVB peptidase [uncultured Gemmiger sp.]